MIDDRITAVAAEIWGDMIDRQTKKAEAIRAKADKDTPTFAVPMRYYCYTVRNIRGKPGIGYQFAYCYTKNVAGYYLSFTIKFEGGKITRSGYIGWKTKREAMSHCRTRYWDAKKPKKERRYILP